ncbi:MAG: nucleotidyltransferase domain-containing protein [Rhizobiaceae bacterium]|nr:nucleotidyltransferase domain-containing protein [Rhizobiaceae bacterium]
MKLADVIAVLKDAEPVLRPRGVTHAAVFGSVARGEERADSDIDIAVELDDSKVLTIYDYVGVKHAVEDLFEGRADVVNRAGLKPYIRERVERDLVHAF